MYLHATRQQHCKPVTDSNKQADYLGRRWGMGLGCFFTVFATFIQTFSPKGNLGCFMAGRFFVGFGQGMALSTFDCCIKVLEFPC